MTQQIGTSRPPAIAHRGEDTASHALLGVAGGGVAVLALLHPTETTFLIAAFATFAFVAGAIALAFGLRRVLTTHHGWGMILEGLGGIFVGVVIFRIVHTLLYLVWTIAGWAAGIGAIVTIFAIVLRAQLPQAGLWLAGGLVMLALGVVLFVATNAGFTASGFLLGIFAGVYAIVQFVLALRHAQS